MEIFDRKLFLFDREPKAGGEFRRWESPPPHSPRPGEAHARRRSRPGGCLAFHISRARATSKFPAPPCPSMRGTNAFYSSESNLAAQTRGRHGRACEPLPTVARAESNVAFLAPPSLPPISPQVRIEVPFPPRPLILRVPVAVGTDLRLRLRSRRQGRQGRRPGRRRARCLFPRSLARSI